MAGTGILSPASATSKSPIPSSSDQIPNPACQPSLGSLRPTRAAVVSPSGPPSVTLGVLPPPLGLGYIPDGTQDLSDERLAKQPGLSAAGDRDVGSGGWLDGEQYGYKVFFNSSMHLTDYSSQQSARSNEAKRGTYPTPPETVIPPQANQNTADLPEPWSDQPFCSTTSPDYPHPQLPSWLVTGIPIRLHLRQRSTWSASAQSPGLNTSEPHLARGFGPWSDRSPACQISPPASNTTTVNRSLATQLAYLGSQSVQRSLPGFCGRPT
ncbi:hypothetical protein CSAL01_10378 [Colletotrichum salicis]|uniref:Uncharacterized protein n=1 Tax=Colletotrichum salicis TaxID=1209931 RepID=A0A135U595_9PEZI|nr:hypothetical protein CSAL01_10378 [Colletotrichum salicis]